jgi:excisionase family DNA binding protein
MLKIQQVAKRLNASDSFVYGLIAGGRLKHHRLGKGQGGIRVTEEQLQEYLLQTEKGQGPPPEREAPVKPIKLSHLEL